MTAACLSKLGSGMFIQMFPLFKHLLYRAVIIVNIYRAFYRLRASTCLPLFLSFGSIGCTVLESPTCRRCRSTATSTLNASASSARPQHVTSVRSDTERLTAASKNKHLSEQCLVHMTS